jgi:hypothetical protein
VNETAFRTLQAAIGEGDRPGKGKNPEAVVRGRKGGKKGGLIRATQLSKKRRKEIGKLGAARRWGKKPK